MMSPTISSNSTVADTLTEEDSSLQKKSTRCVLCSHCEKILVPIEEEITIEPQQEPKPKPKSLPTMLPLPPQTSTEMKPKNEFVACTATIAAVPSKGVFSRIPKFVQIILQTISLRHDSKFLYYRLPINFTTN